MIHHELALLAAPDYRIFVEKLHPNVTGILGVRMQKLRRVAKKLAAQRGLRALNIILPRSYEERLLYGLVIGYAAVSDDKKWAALPEFVKRINAWGICDSGVVTLKFLATDKQRTFDFLERYVDSKKVYDQRFVAVVLKTFFMKSEYFEDVINLYLRLKHADYYVRMAIAWGLAEWAVLEPDKTWAVLPRFHDSIQYKAKRKMIESTRVLPEIKKKCRAK